MKEDLTNGPGFPTGFAMALAQNPDAMDVFSGLTESQRRRVLDKSRRIRSRNPLQIPGFYESESPLSRPVEPLFRAGEPARGNGGCAFGPGRL